MTINPLQPAVRARATGRRRVLILSAVSAAVCLALLGAFGCATDLAGNAKSQAPAQAQPAAQPAAVRPQPSKLSAEAEPDAVRPFRVEVPEAALADLRRRIEATRWPEKETVADATQGVQLATMQKLAKYWAKDYDWRKCEAKLNALPQFITQIDGLEIHFIHVRSKEKNA